jgi:hypothetical protein
LLIVYVDLSIPLSADGANYFTTLVFFGRECFVGGDELLHEALGDLVDFSAQIVGGLAFKAPHAFPRINIIHNRSDKEVFFVYKVDYIT